MAKMTNGVNKQSNNNFDEQKQKCWDKAENEFKNEHRRECMQYNRKKWKMR